MDKEEKKEQDVQDKIKQEENKEKKEKKIKKNKQLEELIIKVKELEEETLRAKADLINYRRRKDDEVSNLLKYANSDLVIQLLPVLDNFERALKNKSENEQLNNFLSGFELIYKNIKEILEANEVKEIEALDKPFDPVYHQSVSSRSDETKEEGIILEVYQKGYTYKDKILRPAMVIINNR